MQFDVLSRFDVAAVVVPAADIVDVHVALLAQEQGHTVVTSDPEDLSAVHPSLPLITV